MNALILKRTPESSLQLPPDFEMTPGGGVLMPDRGPLFLPADGSGQELRPALAVRLSRLGKSIEERFAARYYDAVAAAMIVRPADKGIMGEALAAAADNALCLGRWAQLPEDESSIRLSCKAFDLDVEISQPRRLIDESIATLSRYMTLHMGDILLPFTLPVASPAKPGTIEMTINTELSLSLKIK